MKLKLVAMAIVSLLTSSMVSAAEIYNKSGNKLDFYGKVTGLHYFSEKNSNDGDRTYLRFGIRGETKINERLTGYGQWEYELNGNNYEFSDDINEKRVPLMLAGLKFGELGSLDYGRNHSVVYDVGAFTNVLPEHGGDTWSRINGFLTGHTSGIGVATYRNNNFFGLVNGLNISAQYKGKSDYRDTTASNGESWGFSSSYNFDKFGVSAAYAKADRTNRHIQVIKDIGGDSAKIWAAGLKYNEDNLYLATTYAKTYNIADFGEGHTADKARGFELVAQYQFDFGLRPSIALVKSRGKSNIYKKDLVEYLELGASYFFNKNMSTYIDYKINLLDDPINTNSDNIVAVGMNYQF